MGYCPEMAASRRTTHHGRACGTLRAQPPKTHTQPRLSLLLTSSLHHGRRSKTSPVFPQTRETVERCPVIFRGGDYSHVNHLFKTHFSGSVFLQHGLSERRPVNLRIKLAISARRGVAISFQCQRFNKVRHSIPFFSSLHSVHERVVRVTSLPRLRAHASLTNLDLLDFPDFALGLAHFAGTGHAVSANLRAARPLHHSQVSWAQQVAWKSSS